MNLFNQHQQRAQNPVVPGNSEFALALYQALRPAAGNLFYSPYSISTALAMTYAGAEGETAAQMAQTLCFRLSGEELHRNFAALSEALAAIEQKGAVQFKIANRLWPQEGYALLPGYLELVKRCYGALLTAVDYGNPEAAAQIINDWVAEQTANKIRNLISPNLLTPLTTLVLVNAIYFKGNWASQFDPALTRDEPFWTAPDEQVPTAMMRQTARFNYAERQGLQILELPYSGDDLSMLILLPQQKGGLIELEDRLTAANLTNWTKNLQPTSVQVLLPRFKITFPCELSETLKSMGMIDAFSSAADFSGMDGTLYLYIAYVVHKAFVEVNEEGTEAAAATAVIMARKAMMTPPPLFRADHPFLFLIRESGTGSILFMGRLAKP
jgi:serpin B